MLLLLRKSKDWCLHDGRLTVDRFHALARQYGSRAIWLCESGTLVSEDRDEPAKNFPYEQWRDNAMR